MSPESGHAFRPRVEPGDDAAQGGGRPVAGRPRKDCCRALVHAEGAHDHVRLQRTALRVDDDPIGVEVQIDDAGPDDFQPAAPGDFQHIVVELDAAQRHGRFQLIQHQVLAGAVQDIPRDLPVFQVRGEAHRQALGQQRRQGRGQNADAQVVMAGPGELLAFQDREFYAASGFLGQPLQQQAASDTARTASDDHDPAVVRQPGGVGAGLAPAPRTFPISQRCLSSSGVMHLWAVLLVRQVKNRAPRPYGGPNGGRAATGGQRSKGPAARGPDGRGRRMTRPR